MKFYIVFISASSLLYIIHRSLLIGEYSLHNNISLETIYFYNLFAVILVCSVLHLNAKLKNLANPLGLFIFTTIVKMTVAIIILFPLLSSEKENLLFDITNFFAVYFIFQIAEVISLKDLLK